MKKLATVLVSGLLTMGLVAPTVAAPKKPQTQQVKKSAKKAVKKPVAKKTVKKAQKPAQHKRAAR